ncbi:MAG: hypothetical protein ACOC9N_02575 [Gemmatimonadota bacterium]
MKRRGVLAALTLSTLLAASAPLAAQGLRGDLDVRMESVAFPAYDGTASAGLIRATPLTATVDLTAWDFGVERLSLHLRAGASEDLAAADAWPAVRPRMRLVEGYLEYAVPRLTARAGRTSIHTRLGYESFDGLRLDARPVDGPLTLSAFGGWSLVRGSTLPVTSPEASPLSEFRPAERGILVGAAARAAAGPVRANAVYRREIDPAAEQLASEFVALSATTGITEGVSLALGADYDIGLDDWGSADARLGWDGTVGGRSAGLAVEVRRHMPRFPLWSIWGAFSPVAYTSVGAQASVVPLDGFRLRASGDRFEYEETGSESPLVSLEDDGWRWTAGAGWSGLERWSFDLAFGAEYGPGASSTHVRVSAAWQALDDLRAGAWLARGTRPLEYRIDDAVVRSAGVDFRLGLTDDVDLEGGVAWQDEEREGSLGRQLDYWRVRAGVSYGFGTGMSRPDLHPAILRVPERPNP